MPPVSHPNLLVSTDTADDAGIYKIQDNLALIQTIDFFTPVLDNHYDYGKVVAANCLSDVYAMGGRPITAMNIVGFPKANMKIKELSEILKGAASKAGEANCPIVGGHTMLDFEFKYGLAVTGVINPKDIIKNCTAKPGDKIILTKPLGSGILTTVLQRGKLEKDLIQKVTAVMTQLNKTASEIMVKYKANAATDITGFGLLGHSFEMAHASNVSMILHFDNIPVIQETLDKAKTEDFIPPLTRENKEFLEKYVKFSDDIEENEQTIIYDSQTSGGLLITVEEEKAVKIVKEMQKEGITDASIIGEVTKYGKFPIKVLR